MGEFEGGVSFKQNFYVVNFELAECSPRIAYPDSVFYQKISIYPNPASEYVSISLSGTSQADEQPTFEIVDELGKKVASIPVLASSNTSDWQIPVSQLPSGFYVIKMKLQGSEFQYKLFIQ